MSEFQSNAERNSQLGEATPFIIQGMESLPSSTSARDIDELLAQLTDKDLTKEGADGIVRQLGYIFSEYQDRDFAARIEHCERIAWSLLDSPHEYWREAVRYLDDACTLRIECARTGEYYDGQVLSHRMLIVGCYRQFSDCRDDYEAYGKSVTKAFDQLAPYVASERHSIPSKERALSIAYSLVEAMPVCFWARTQDIANALGAMVKLAGGVYHAPSTTTDLSSWGDNVNLACSAYLWGALSVYYATTAAVTNDRTYLDSALRAASKHFQMLYKAAMAIPDRDTTLAKDSLGREIPARLLIAKELVMSRVSLAERQLEVGDVAAFSLSWHYAVDNSSIVDHEQFEKLVSRFSVRAEMIAKKGARAEASEIELALARACRNRPEVDYGQAFEHYSAAANYLGETGQIGQLSRILDEAISFFRRNERKFGEDDFQWAGRFMLQAYNHFSGIQREFEWEEISESPIDFSPFDDSLPHRLVVHPLAADASPILRDLIDACDVREGLPGALQLRISAHLCFSEYAAERGWEHLIAIHIDSTYELLGGACGDYPEVSPYQLVNTQLRLGKLMRERGATSDFRAFCLFENALKVINEHNLKLAVRDHADLYYSVGLYHADRDRYGEAIARFNKAYSLLDPVNIPEHRILALKILRSWGETEIADGDPERGNSLLGEFESSIYDWRLSEFF